MRKTGQHVISTEYEVGSVKKRIINLMIGSFRSPIRCTSSLVLRRLQLLPLLIISFYAQAQLPTQQLRGTILDQVLQTPIEGATVTIAGLNKSVTTDAKGSFRFAGIP